MFHVTRTWQYLTTFVHVFRLVSNFDSFSLQLSRNTRNIYLFYSLIRGSCLGTFTNHCSQSAIRTCPWLTRPAETILRRLELNRFRRNERRETRDSEESILLFPTSERAANRAGTRRLGPVGDLAKRGAAPLWLLTLLRSRGALRSWERPREEPQLVEKQWGGSDRTRTRSAALLIRHEANKKSRTMAAAAAAAVSSAAHLPPFVLPPSCVPLSTTAQQSWPRLRGNMEETGTLLTRGTLRFHEVAAFW